MVDPTRGGRVAAALAILALSALLLTPFVFQTTIARHRLTYNALDPAREASSQVLLALAREIGAIRGFLLTRDTSLLADYRGARTEQDRALDRLLAIQHGDIAITRQAQALAAAARAWNVSNDELARGAITVRLATERLGTQQQKYHAALNEGQSLERLLAGAVTGVRARVGRLERYWAVATAGLAILAAAGALMVILMMRSSHRQSTLARTDPLTGLYNRLGFSELATRELSRARRNGTTTSLMSFDLDGFKQINDRQGHAAGDDLLRIVSAAIRGAIRDIDVPARLGGDEFAILLPDNRAEPPERAVERVRAAIMQTLSAARSPVTLSVGAITVRDRDIGIDQMVHDSDKLMYAVKNAGKNALLHSVVGPVT